MTQTFDSHRLAAMVIAKRDGRGLWATAAEIGGISASTLSRIEQGKVPDLDTFLRLCRWLRVSADEFTERSAVTTREDDAQRVDVIAAHLRADRTLDRDTARALERMVALHTRLPPAGSFARQRVTSATGVQDLGRERGIPGSFPGGPGGSSPPSRPAPSAASPCHRTRPRSSPA